MVLPRRKQPRTALIAIIGLLLLFVLSRTYHVLALPPFLDESEQIRYAQNAIRGQLLSGAGNARLLGGWWVGSFGDYGDPALWLDRIATILFSLISAAVIYSVTKRLVSAWAGLLAVLLYILMPFALFHERLGLSDPYASVCGALALWLAMCYVARGQTVDAVLSGLMVTGAIIGKGTGLMLTIIPAVVFVMLIPLARRRKLIVGLIAAYGTLALTWIPFYLYLRILGYDYFRIPTTGVGTSQVAGISDRLAENLRVLWSMETGYLSVPFVVVAVLLMLYLIVRRPRPGLMLALITLVPAVGLLAFGTNLSGRYFLLHLPPLAICLGAALSVLAEDLRRYARFSRPLAIGIPTALVAVWAIFVALPFAFAMYSNPASQPLPSNDQYQYYEHDASGYGINDAAAFLIHQQSRQQETIHVIGILSNCNGLQHQIPSRSGIVVECPLFIYDIRQQPMVAAFINQQAFKATADHYDLWIVHEYLPNAMFLATLNGVEVPYQNVMSFYRPGNFSSVTLYHVQ